MNRGSSWVVTSQQSASLLDHEQGHYNITWLVMRELCRQLLNDEWDASVLSATNTSSAAQVRDRFTTDFTRLSQAARSEVARLNILYDSVPETNHGANPIPQGRWDRMFQYVIQNPESDLTTLLMLGGGSPTGF
ncbi:MAG: hypothetical protein LAQ69_30065 [Acidobacteriia bacterium]|nr:hypothetical protein [Terriglobia bacterium]